MLCWLPCAWRQRKDNRLEGMNENLQRLSCLSLAIAIALTGCATDESPESLALLGNVVVIRLPGGAEGVSGVCYAEDTRQTRPEGVLDLMLNNEYVFFPQISNLLKQTQQLTQTKAKDLRGDASLISITGANIEMSYNKTSSPFASTQVQKTWWVPFFTTVKAQNTTTSRFSLLIPNVGEALRKDWAKLPPTKRYATTQTLILKIFIEGKMQDGEHVRSQAVEYPLKVCWGCLVSVPGVFPGVGSDPEKQYGFCNSKVIGAEFNMPCTLGNDEFVPCTLYCATCDLDQNCDPKYCPSS
jgi:hypothetical protein